MESRSSICRCSASRATESMAASSRSRSRRISPLRATHSSSASKPVGGNAMGFEPREYLEQSLPVLLAASRLPPPRPLLVVQLVLADRDDCDVHYRITGDGVEARRGFSD